MIRQKKAWLKECWNLQRTIDYCDEILREPSVYNSPGFGERVATSKGNGEEQKVHRKMAEVDRAVKDREKAMVELEKRKAAINKLKDGNQKKILWLRYIGHYSWEAVCLATNYSRKQCNRIHDGALFFLDMTQNDTK